MRRGGRVHGHDRGAGRGSAPRAGRRACAATPWGGPGVEPRAARRRLRGRPCAGSDRDRGTVRRGGPVAARCLRTYRRRRVRRARAASFSAATPERCPRPAGATRGLARDRSDRWSGRGSMRRHARCRRARYRRALGLRRGRRRDGRRGRRGRGARSRSRSGSGRRSRCRRRCCSRRRRRRRCTGREQRGGIDIRVAVAAPDAEMHVRRVVLGVAGHPGCGERRPLEHDVAATHEQRAEMRQRDLVPVTRRDGDGEPVRRHRPGEGDLARRGSTRSLCVFDRDVDASVLPARVRVVAERERAEDRAVRRPAPGCGVGRSRERPDERRGREEPPRCR
jgi:hypothetical protein